jgi:2-amino-4-hydroxy-6-hydroxymethyldihydropteridine diphosphokinase
VDRAVAPDRRPVAIALGSNIGDRHAALAFAVERLSHVLSDLSVSDFIETDPEGEGIAEHPLFLNAAIAGTTILTPRALLDELLAIERDYGRERPYRHAPRTLDLDLVLFDDLAVDEPGLQVPHPRFRERFFVLGPLAQVAPDMRDPSTGLRVGELLQRLLRDQAR